MCGIAGIIGSRANIDTVNLMTQRLRHRGPDGAGVWSEPGVAFGHRRLSILDLSHAADQPMVLGEHVLTYNGEIYNYQALRAALPGPWRSTRRYGGVAAPPGAGRPRLSRRTRRHVCLRHAGMPASGGCSSCGTGSASSRCITEILPDGIAFASELKALLVLGNPQIDASAVRDYLFHGYIPAPKTIYRGICKLPAGHLLTWQDGRVEIERYWRPSSAIDREAPSRHADGAR